MVAFVYGVCELDKAQGQRAACIAEGLAKTGDRERLARWTADEHVARRRVFDELQEVAVKGHVWEAMREHGAGERFYLREADGLPAKGLPSDRRGLDTGADGEIGYGLTHVFFISRGWTDVDV